MRAAVQRTHGGPEVLVVQDVPDPEPGPADVVIEVRATTVNHLDLVQRAGWFCLEGFSLPHVPGMDVAGVVVAVGAEVDRPAVGDRVVVDPSMVGVGAGSKLVGMGDLYGALGVIGATLNGGYAELCLAPASHCHPIPDEVTMADAAAFPTVWTTAWHALFDVGDLRLGETVLIHAAASGVSAAAIQLAKRAGATVLATAGSEAKLQLARQLGADHVANNRTDDVTGFAREVTGGTGVDMVLDHVGPALWAPSMFALRPRGRLVTCGNTTGNEVAVNLGFVYHTGIRILGSDGYRPEEFAAAWQVFSTGSFATFVDSEMSLDDVAEAHRRLEANEVVGKVVLVPPTT